MSHACRLRAANDKRADGAVAIGPGMWLNRALSNKERKHAVYAWRVELLDVGRKIVQLERRAREAAARQGKAAEVEEATGDVQVVEEADDHPEAEKTAAGA